MEQVDTPYQVFINHRGPDVKKTVASLIYHRLRSYGLSVFLDKGESRAGDNISHTILGAIRNALVHVTIFSERYAESKWCLDELCWILRSHHERNTKIIPVFADVEPSDLRHIESGRYADAFEKHQQKARFTAEVINNWKAALNQASRICGPLFKTCGSDYGEILEQIVDGVIKEISKREALDVAKYPVGLDQVAEDFQDEIRKHSHSNATRIIGITGMGGVGKSTFAKHLYNLKRSDFSRSSILSEVRKRRLQSLQKKLLRDMLGNYDLQHIDTVCQGRRILRDCLPRLPPVFIVLDDIDNMDQIESLLDVDAVASGSLILITSRDKDLLRRSSTKTLVYDVKPLHKKHARELFCRHAFSRSKPSEELRDLVEELLNICGGLPLSLRVLGGLFVGRCDKEYWRRQLEKLSTTLPYEIIKSFRVSYEALDPEEKEVFLDIGCFLVGEEKDLALRVLEGLHGNNRIGDHLESLRQKCLLDIHYDTQSDYEIECRKRENPMIGYESGSYKLTMHDQLRELARHIAREEYNDNRVFPTCNPLRLSSLNDIDEMLLSQAGSKAKASSSLQIRGIRSSEDKKRLANDDQTSPCSFMNEISVEGVRLFVVEGAFRDLPFDSWNMVGELVWLRLRSHANINPRRSFMSLERFNIPLNVSFDFLRSMSLRGLKVLEIQGPGNSVERLFDNLGADLPRQLTDLNIVFTQPKTFTGRSAHISAQSGQPEFSRQRRSLISPSRQAGSSLFRYIENLVTVMKTLTRLVLKNLGFLKSLPIDFSQLQNLRHLDLSGCFQLTELPDTFSELLQLQYLSLQHCSNLSIPLHTLGEMSTLEYVDFRGCANLVFLPDRIPYQRNLRYLNLRDTDLLQIPENLAILDKLEQLTIGSPELTELPLSLAKLKGLTELFLIKCSGLKHILPKGIAASNIKVLAIESSPLSDFSFEDQGNEEVEMKNLRDFTLKNTAISEISIPEGVYPRLERMDLSENIKLIHVNALPLGLVTLNMQKCWGLKTLTSLSNLGNLKLLNINGCVELETLNVEGLISLEQIKAEKCWKLRRIEGLSQRERMDCLNVSTDNRVIWNDICEFLISPSQQKPSTAIFSGRKEAHDKMLDRGEMLRIAQKFNLKIHDVISYLELENIQSHGAILMFFITYHACRAFQFRVTFNPSNYDYGESELEYSSFHGNRGGRSIHAFMWTEDSHLFKECMHSNTTHVYCSHDSMGDEEEQNCGTDDDEDEQSDDEDGTKEIRSVVECGWLTVVDRRTDVSEVFKDFIMAYR